MATADKSGRLPRLITASKAALAERGLQTRFAELVERRFNRRIVQAKDVALLQRAFDFASEQHQSQTRRSGEPFLSHPLEVAHILADLRLDVTSLCAALLHDIVEDTHIPLSVITSQFGPDTARLVEGVTKISRLELMSPEARNIESVRKMLLAMVTDVRVVLVKLADRLHNMRTLGFMPPEKQERIARETLDIYAPIAHPAGYGPDSRRSWKTWRSAIWSRRPIKNLQKTVADRAKQYEASF